MRRIVVGYWIVSVIAIAPLSAPARAAVPDTSSKALVGILACRAVADEHARLLCFDTKSRALADAQASHEIVVMDRDQVRATRRSVFGLTLPHLPLFGNDGAPDKEEVQQIEAVVSAANVDGDGRWLITLQDGARWRQIDGNNIPRAPHNGSKVVIRRAALGSFYLRVDGQNGVKAQRIS